MQATGRSGGSVMLVTGSYSIGILAWSLIGLSGSTVLAAVRVAFKSSLGCRDIGAVSYQFRSVVYWHDHLVRQ